MILIPIIITTVTIVLAVGLIMIWIKWQREDRIMEAEVSAARTAWLAAQADLDRALDEYEASIRKFEAVPWPKPKQRTLN